MEPEGSLSHSQMPATSTYPEPDQSSPCPYIHFLKIHHNYIPPLTPGFSKWFFPSGFPTKTLYASLLNPVIYMSSPSHSSRFDHRDNIGEYRSLISSLCSFIHSPVTWSHLGQKSLISTLFSNTLSLRSFHIASD
jgi:hypothetical protein